MFMRASVGMIAQKKRRVRRTERAHAINRAY